MVGSMFSYFGFGRGSAQPVQPVQPVEPVESAPTVDPMQPVCLQKVESKDAVRALPGSWYTSEEMYQLERRAIFSRRWVLITHSMRLKETGDWLRYDYANFNFWVCRDQEGKINGFRDACDFDTVQSGILPIHVRLDHNGFIWVNMDGKETPEIPWEEDFDGIDRQDRYEGLNFENYEFDHGWEMQGDYNWKILADNYNECYHCATTHPDLNALTNLHSYYVDTDGGWIKHYVATKPEQEAKGMRVHPTYFYPSTSMNISMHFIMIQRFVPHGPVKSTMRYEVYRNKNSNEDDFQIINEMYKRVMSEDKALCEAAQANINAGIFVNGEMHPRLEKGPLFFQRLCREAVTDFHKREKAAGHKIWPAQQTIPAAVKEPVVYEYPVVAHQTTQEVVSF